MSALYHIAQNESPRLLSSEWWEAALQTCVSANVLFFAPTTKMLTSVTGCRYPCLTLHLTLFVSGRITLETSSILAFRKSPKTGHTLTTCWGWVSERAVRTTNTWTESGGGLSRRRIDKALWCLLCSLLYHISFYFDLLSISHKHAHNHNMSHTRSLFYCKEHRGNYWRDATSASTVK